MCGFPTSCLEIQLLALVGLDVMVLGGEPLRLYGLHAWPATPVWGGRQAEEQEAGVASEGGGEDEGGEGDAVGDQDDWENPSATRANNVQLSSREFV